MTDKTLISTILFHLCFIIWVSGQNKFDVRHIPDSLMLKSNAVIREYKTVYNRTSEEKYTKTVSYVVTVLNQKGNPASRLEIHYDKDKKVSGIKGCAYDKQGFPTWKLDKKDVKDYAVNDHYTLYSDQRTKYFNPVAGQYPYTIEYEYTLECKGIVAFDTWLPNSGFGISVQEAELIFNTPKKWDIKFLGLNYPFKSEMDTTGESVICHWSVKNIPAIGYEPFSPVMTDYFPSILLSPDCIAYEGTRGDFSSWTEYGKWVYSLIKDKDQLPQETTDFIKSLTDTIHAGKEKIKAVYRFMQSKTRYVNIAYGIGGFQPVSAAEADEKGYGDCKALSNYTKALLNCIGIEAFYTEIGSGSIQEIRYPEFTSANQTNHVILCVPNDGDTLWLECTSRNIPAGYIGADNSDRLALLIKPEGGVLARTPGLPGHENQRISGITINISDDGNAEFTLNSLFTGYMFEDILGLMNQSPKEQKESLLERYAINGLTIAAFHTATLSDTSAKGLLHIQGNIDRFVTKTGHHVFFSPGYFHWNTMTDLIGKDRKQPVFQRHGFTVIDTIHIILSGSYEIESWPQNTGITSAYGEFNAIVEKEDAGIRIIRKTVINKGTYGAELFHEINDFLTRVNDFEKQKIIATQK